jgi:hypothetical protein
MLAPSLNLKDSRVLPARLIAVMIVKHHHGPGNIFDRFNIKEEDLHMSAMTADDKQNCTNQSPRFTGSRPTSHGSRPTCPLSINNIATGAPTDDLIR